MGRTGRRRCREATSRPRSAPPDADDRIIYNFNNDNLYYDRDGTGSAAAVAFAHVNGNPNLTNADFVVVA